MYEELLMAEEGLQKTAHEKIFIGKPLEFDREEFLKQLQELKKEGLSGWRTYSRVSKGNRKYIQISVKNKMQNNEERKTDDSISIRFYGNLV